MESLLWVVKSQESILTNDYNLDHGNTGRSQKYNEVLADVKHKGNDIEKGIFEGCFMMCHSFEHFLNGELLEGTIHPFSILCYSFQL